MTRGKKMGMGQMRRTAARRMVEMTAARGPPLPMYPSSGLLLVLLLGWQACSYERDRRRMSYQKLETVVLVHLAARIAQAKGYVHVTGTFKLVYRRILNRLPL